MHHLSGGRFQNGVENKEANSRQKKLEKMLLVEESGSKGVVEHGGPMSCVFELDSNTLGSFNRDSHRIMGVKVGNISEGIMAEKGRR